METEFIDDENIPLLQTDENNDDSVYEDTQTETSFSQDDVSSIRLYEPSSVDVKKSLKN